MTIYSRGISPFLLFGLGATKDYVPLIPSGECQYNMGISATSREKH